MGYLGQSPPAGVSEGFPAVCLDTTGGVWTWLCGEPIPETLRPFLHRIEAVQVPPTPGTAEYDPAPSTEAPVTTTTEAELAAAPPILPGFGLLGWVALYLIGRGLE